MGSINPRLLPNGNVRYKTKIVLRSQTMLPTPRSGSQDKIHMCRTLLLLEPAHVPSCWVCHIPS